MHLTSDKGGNAKLSDKDIVQRFAAREELSHNIQIRPAFTSYSQHILPDRTQHIADRETQIIYRQNDRQTNRVS